MKGVKNTYKVEKDKYLQQELIIQNQDAHRINLRYETELKFEKEKNDTLQKIT